MVFRRRPAIEFAAGQVWRTGDSLAARGHPGTTTAPTVRTILETHGRTLTREAGMKVRLQDDRTMVLGDVAMRAWVVKNRATLIAGPETAR